MKKIKRLSIVFFLVGIVFLNIPQGVCLDEETKKEDCENLMDRALGGQKLIFNRNYAEALAVFKNMQDSCNHSPLGFFGEMAIYEVQMLENEDFHLEKKFLDAAKRGDAAVNHVMQLYHPTEDELFYSAAVIGLDGFFQARKSNWWSAYTKGTRSRQIFNRILKSDPKFIDAKLGTGMYIYWRSVFTKEISFLPFFADKRAEGIAIVKDVSEKAKFAAEIAKINLGLIYFEEKRYKDAQKVFAEFVKNYPNTIIFRALLGKVYLADKQYKNSLAIFEESLKIDPSINKTRYFVGMAIALDDDKTKFDYGKKQLNLFLEKENQRLWRSYGFYWLGFISEKQGLKEDAKKYYEEAINLNKGLKQVQVRVRGLGGGI